MTIPYVPEGGALVEVTTRTQDARFLLKPSDPLNAIIVGVLARAKERYPLGGKCQPIRPGGRCRNPPWRANRANLPLAAHRGRCYCGVVIRAVVDTNVLLEGLTRRGPAGDVVDAWVERRL